MTRDLEIVYIFQDYYISIIIFLTKHAQYR